MASKFRYILSNRLGTLQTQPLGESDFTITWTLRDDGNRGHQKEFPNSVIFTGGAFQNLNKIEKSIYRCDLVTLIIEEVCTESGAEVWQPSFEGKMSLNDGDWDPINCRVTIAVQDEEPNACYESNKDTELNLFEKIPAVDRHTVSIYPPNIEIEKRDYTINGAFPCPNYVWQDSGDPFALQWIIYYDRRNRYTGGSCDRQTKWARMVLTIPCDQEPPTPEWVLIESDCPGGTKKYARPANLYGRTYTSSSPAQGQFETIYEWKIVGDEGGPQEIDNGMRLFDVLNMFLNEFCPGMIVKSEFFQFNPDFPTDINYVTNSPSKVRGIFVFHKSDVKRPGDAENASIAKWEWQGLMNALTRMFQTEWWIAGNEFHVEHVSYRNRNAGLDLTLPRYVKWVKDKIGYSYDNAEIPVRDEFSFMEASEGDFAGVPIIYTTCLSKQSKDNKRQNTVEDVTTDVELMLANPDDESDVVQDEGFAFIATEQIEGVTVILTEDGILSPSKLNNSLSWAHLQNDYYRHARPVGQGILNNQPVTFFSTVPTKKGEPVRIPFCCGDVFNPDDFITTPMGVGIVSSAEFSFKDQMITLELLYNAEDGLIENAAPTAVNDVFTIPQDQPAILDVLANDIESDQDGQFTQINIILPPEHGSIVITPDLKVLYTPNPGYIGPDNFVYQVLDDWSEASNDALVAITIFQQDGPPVAVDDSYQTFEGRQLTVPAPGVLGNDGSNNGLYLSTYDNVSAEGGSIIMQNDGSFVYTPPAGFIGVDTFTYTVINDLNLTDTATVSIEVVDGSMPIAVNDEYSTDANNVLSVPAPGLLTNDLTLIGVLQAVPQVIATAAGGTVAINADGSFTYNRPPGAFAGEDNFDYTVTNGTQSDQGHVVINVFPRIFARIEIPENEKNTVLVYETCSGQQKVIGSQVFGNVHVKFYSDPAGTVPMNVTNFNITVNYQQRIRELFSGQDETNDFSKLAVPAPGSFQLESGVLLQDFRKTCGGQRIFEQTITYSLLPGIYTII